MINKVTAADGTVTTVVTFDAKAISEAFSQLQKEGSANSAKVISIKINGADASGTIQATLPVSALLEGLKNVPNVVVSVQTDGQGYSLPISVIDFGSLAKKLGTNTANITLKVNIAPVGTSTQSQISTSAGNAGVTPIGGAVDFSVTASGNGGTAELNDFGTTYVERFIVLPNSVDPAAATAVLYDPATGSLTFVPGIFEKNADGKNVVRIKRNGNSIYTAVTSKKSFTDTSSHWAKADIELLASKLIVSGKTDTTFAPQNSITRAEFAALLVRSLALTADKSAAASFTDVKDGDWYSGVVGAAVKAGLVNGFENHTFKPKDLITREQMAVMISRAFEAVGKKVQAADSNLSKFSDKASISSWANESVSQSVQAGIINGMTDTTFVPSANASRAQATVMLKRYLQYVKFINE
jgi:hypothetical protein